MIDEPGVVDEPDRGDLFARIRNLEADGPQPAAPVADAVRQAVADLLPGLVRDAVASALADVVPSVLDEAIEARLAAIEDTLDGVGDRFEALARDGVAQALGALDGLRADLHRASRTPGGPAADGDATSELALLRGDLANALEFVRTSLAADAEARAAEVREGVRALLAAHVLDVRTDVATMAAELLAAMAAPVSLEPVLDRLDAVAAEVERLATRPAP